MKYNREWAVEKYNAGEDIQVIAFWGHTPNPKKMTKACCSQWYDCLFEVDGVQYHTTEQYMMSQKALGRLVQNFDGSVWDQHKYEIVLRGNLAKFGQNPELWAFLNGTGDSVLVEGSPYDGIWGVNLSIDDPRIHNPNAWQGENLLGFALMETRDILREKQADHL